jgi:hypothetical protein
MKYILTILVLATLLTACGEDENAPKTSGSANSVVFTDAWQTRWLRGEPCSAPCWENITPGKTTADEAMQILKKNDQFTKLVVKFPENQDYGLLSWQWLIPKEADDSKRRGGYVSFAANNSNKVVDTIGPVLANFVLGDIMKKYGEPTHVVAVTKPTPPSYKTHYTLYLLYLNDKGFMVSNEFPEVPEIEPALWMGNVKFFRPNLQDLDELKQLGVEKEYLVKWEGTRYFQYYCREGAKGQVVVCPLSRF